MTAPKTPYTPGPWTAIADPLHFDSLTTVVGGSVNNAHSIPSHMIVQVGGYARIEEAEANTRLIAAAPDLYAALKQMIEAMVRYEMDIAGEGDAPQRHRDLMRKARSALKKARGEND